MREPVLYIMVGCSGSGKSTIAEAICRTYKDTYLVSPDNFRKLLCNDVNCQSKNKQVFDRAYLTMNYFLKLGCNVVFDATNVSAIGRNKLIKKVEIDCEIKFIYVKVDLRVALDRVKSRTNGQVVPEDVVISQYEKLQYSEKYLLNCPFDVIVIKNNKEIDVKTIDKLLFT